ncbi:MAG: carbohydrate ABC transporter permease [Chloroflexi bacterium]|nr:carbohydrate ABC transporter permease [Chloroflexota bacterium]
MKISRVAMPILLTWITAVFGLPLYMALVNTFKTQEQILADPLGFPAPFTFNNLINAFSRPDNLIARGLLNSTILVVVSVFFIVILSSAIGYYIARNNTRFTQGLQLLFMAGMMIPAQVYLIPIVQIFRTFHLIGSYFGVLVVFTGGGLLSFAVFVYTGFIKNIPRELEEAAMIDGANKFQMFWKILFPLLRPATATVVIFLTLWIWNEFLMPLILLGPGNGVTITLGVYMSLGQLYTINYGQMFAIMMIASFPMLIFFFTFQKEFIAGLLGGSLKG